MKDVRPLTLFWFGVFGSLAYNLISMTFMSTFLLNPKDFSWVAIISGSIITWLLGALPAFTVLALIAWLVNRQPSKQSAKRVLRRCFLVGTLILAASGCWIWNAWLSSSTASFWHVFVIFEITFVSFVMCLVIAIQAAMEKCGLKECLPVHLDPGAFAILEDEKLE